MISFSKLSRGAAAIMVVVCITVSQSSGQSVWLDPTFDQGLSLEILKPDFISPGDHEYSGSYLKPWASVWFVTARVKLSDAVRLIVELPSSHYDAMRIYRWYDDWEYYNYNYREYEMDGQSIIGNPLVGIEHRSESPRSFYQQLAFRFPLNDLAKSSEQRLGQIADVNRFDAFTGDWAALKARFGTRYMGQSGLGYHFFAGPDWLLSPGDSGGDDELFLDYGGQIWLQTDIARMGAGVTGQYLITEDDASFGEKNINQFGFTASFGSGRVCPGIHMRVPLGDDYGLISMQYVWGLNLVVKLGEKS
jgi:hypothetical protein